VKSERRESELGRKRGERRRAHLIATENDTVSIPIHEEHGYGRRGLAIEPFWESKEGKDDGVSFEMKEVKEGRRRRDEGTHQSSKARLNHGSEEADM